MVGIELRQFTVHDGKVELHGICKGAGLGPAGNLRRNGTVEYYLSEDVVHDEQKGVGVCMMAYAEYLQAKQAGALTNDFPKVEIFNKGYDPIMPGDRRLSPLRRTVWAKQGELYAVFHSKAGGSWRVQCGPQPNA